MAVIVERLKRRSDFLRVAALRRKWAAPGLILQAAPMPAPAAPPPSGDPNPPPPAGGDAETPPAGGAFVSPPPSPPSSGPAPAAPPRLRVGFTCSKKVGNSVARNRARRRLRAAVAQIMPRAALPGYDYVVIGRQETLSRPFDLLLKDLQTALKRVGAWREDGRAFGMSEGQDR